MPRPVLSSAVRRILPKAMLVAMGGIAFAEAVRMAVDDPVPEAAVRVADRVASPAEAQLVLPLPESAGETARIDDAGDDVAAYDGPASAGVAVSAPGVEPAYRPFAAPGVEPAYRPFAAPTPTSGVATASVAGVGSAVSEAPAARIAWTTGSAPVASPFQGAFVSGGVSRAPVLPSATSSVLASSADFTRASYAAPAGDPVSADPAPLANYTYTTPGPDGTYSNVHPVDTSGVFAGAKQKDSRLGVQKGIILYFHDPSDPTMYDAASQHGTKYNMMLQAVDKYRSMVAAMSGGQMDIQYTIVDVPVTAQANGNAYSPSSAAAALLPALGYNISDYQYATWFVGPGLSTSVMTQASGTGTVGNGSGTQWSNIGGDSISAQYILHELGHNLGFNHAPAFENYSSTTTPAPGYTYDFSTGTYTAVTVTNASSLTLPSSPTMPTIVIGGEREREYGNPYDLMAVNGGLSPRQKQAETWIGQSNFADINKLVAPGTTSTIRLYDDMADMTVVTNGGTGTGLLYGVARGYQNLTYDAYFTRQGYSFHVNSDGTGKWVPYEQLFDFYYRSAGQVYPGQEANLGTPDGVVVEINGIYLGYLTKGQVFLEKYAATSLFIPITAGNNSNSPAINIDDGTGVTGANRDLLSYHPGAPMNPDRQRSVWYQVTYANNGVDANGHWADIGVQAFSGAQVYGWQWDANSGTAGAQDGSGTWTTTGGNWRSVSLGTDNLGWTQLEDATFGVGSGAAGTVTLSGAITVNSLTFNKPGSGHYTLTGGSVAIDIGGIMVVDSATIASAVSLTSTQFWSVDAGQTLTVSGAITPGTGRILYKNGQGTLALTGVNTWTSDLRVVEGLVTQSANQTFSSSADLCLEQDSTYRILSGTLTLNSGSVVSSTPLTSNSVTITTSLTRDLAVGTLQLSSTTATGTVPEVAFAATGTIAANVLLDAGTHYINVNGSSTTGTISGGISGTGGITKGGSNTLVLSGANTFTGALVINAGTVILNALGAAGGTPDVVLNAGQLTVSDPYVVTGVVAQIGNLTGAAGSSVNVNYNSTTGIRRLGVAQTVDGVFAGTLLDGGSSRYLGLIKTGSAKLILSGANTYSGGTTISAGTLQIGNGGTTGTIGTGAVVNNASLVYNRSDAVTVSNAISGTGSLTKNGASSLTLSGANTYSGATLINTGSVVAGAANVLGSGSAITLANVSGVSLNTAGYNQSVGSLVGGGATGGNITLGASVLTTGTDNTAAAYAGVISGAGSLVKTGAGTQTLTGKNTYTGSTTVSGGVLALDFSASGAPTSDIVSASSALVMNGGTLRVTGKSGATLTQTFASTLVSSGVSTIALDRNGATSLDVTLGAITRSGGGTINFTGATGAAAGARFKTTTGAANALLDGGAAWALYNGADWAAKDATNTYIVAYTGYSDIATNGGVIPDASAADVRIVEGGAGTNTLAAATTTVNSLLMTAGTTAAAVNFAGRTLVVGAGASGGIAIASGAQAATFGASANDGVLTVGATSGAKTLTLISNNAASNRAPVFNAKIADNGAGGVVSVVASGGSASGTIVFAGDNTYSGTTSVTNGGVLQIGNGGANGSLGTGAASVDAGARLAFARSGTAVVANTISGAGAVEQRGSGTLTLTGANTYSGGTTIASGTLQVGNGGTAGSLGSGAVVDNAALVFNRSDAISVANAISGTGTLTKNGAGVLTLTGANTYAGATTIASGTLQLGGAGSLGGGAYSGAVANAGVLQFASTAAQTLSGVVSGAGSVVQSGSGATTLSGANTYSGGTGVTGGVLVAGSASALGSGAVSVTGGALDLNAATVSLGALTVDGGTVRNGTLNATSYTLKSGVVSAVIAGAVGLSQSGSGTTTLSGANTYTGGTTIATGTLVAGSSTAFGTGTVALTGGTLSLSGAALANATTFTSGNIAGTGSFTGTVSGSGTVGIATEGVVKFTKTSSFTGTYNVTSGTLAFNTSPGNGGSYALAATGGTVNLAAGTLLDLTQTESNGYGAANTYTLGSTLSLAGATVNAGGTTGAMFQRIAATTSLALSGDNTIAQASGGYGQILVVEGAVSGSGTLSLGRQNLSGTGSFLELKGSMAGYSGNVTMASPGTSSVGYVIFGNASGWGSGSLTLSGTNSNVLIGDKPATDFNSSWTGGSAIAFKTGTLAATGAVTVNAGATLQVNNASTYAVVLQTNGGLTLNGGTLSALGTGGTSAFAPNGTWTFGGATTSTVSASVRLLNAGTVFTVGSGSTAAISGVVSGSNGFTTNGGGAVVLSGANTYTGTATIGAGRVTTASTQALGAGSVSVIAGGVLVIGDGTTNGVTLASGATLATVSGGALQFYAATSKITLQGTGGYTLASGTTLDLNNNFNAIGTYTLITGGTGTKSAGSLTLAGVSAAYSYSLANGVLTVSAVPEPSVWGLLGASGLALAAVRRRRLG